MTSESIHPRLQPLPTTPAEPARRPVASVAQGTYLDWPAVLAGGALALALSLMLLSFGAGLGLSLASPYRGEGVSASWLAIAAGIWLAWVMVTSFGAGGYLTGRLRQRIGDATEDEVAARDGAHGLLVWATGALVSAVMLASGVGGALSTGGTAAASVANAAAESADNAYFSALLLRPAPGGDDRSVIDPALGPEIGGILTRSTGAGAMTARDRSYLAERIARHTSLDEAGALGRIDAVLAERAAARDAAVAVAEQARRATVVFGFITAATLLAGALAAFFAAAAGGRHRDAGLGMDVLIARR